MTVQVYADITRQWVTSDASETIEWQIDGRGRRSLLGRPAPEPAAPDPEGRDGPMGHASVWATPGSSGTDLSVRCRGRRPEPVRRQGRPSRPLGPFPPDEQRPAAGVRLRPRPGQDARRLGQLRHRPRADAAGELRPGRDAAGAALDPVLVGLAGDDRRVSGRRRRRRGSVQQRWTPRSSRPRPRRPEPGYSAICALALRQCYGATELAIGPDGPARGCSARRSPRTAI